MAACVSHIARPSTGCAHDETCGGGGVEDAERAARRTRWHCQETPCRCRRDAGGGCAHHGVCLTILRLFSLQNISRIAHFFEVWTCIASSRTLLIIYRSPRI